MATTEKRGASELTAGDKVEAMHNVWANALQCINPSPEFCERVGRLIIEKLNASDVELDSLGVRHGAVAYFEVTKS